MISLNDYLDSGDTVLKILKNYSNDLRESAIKTKNQIDMAHSNFLIQIIEILEHNDFLTSQSQRIRDFYIYMTKEYPFLAFTFKGRIKSLIRAEEKFNGYIVEYIYNYYVENGSYPTVQQIKDQLYWLKDLIAYRIVISVPRCQIKEGENRHEKEVNLLYEIANALPEYLEERGFSALPSGKTGVDNINGKLNENVAPYYRDYIDNKKQLGYESLHIAFYDNFARCHAELQLRTKDMDDYAEIGPANHLGYEKRQEAERRRRSAIPVGECPYFDDAYERGMLLQQLELADVDVNMFSAHDNLLMNDGCGLYRGRQILPFEHLSRFQNDLV